jgi:response regulator RpfG family c-di-GMP phosphodiesterase
MQNKKTILAIDDMATQLFIYKSILKHQYNVIISESAVKAMDMLGNIQADIILVDIEMPEMTGIEFLQAIRKKPHLQAIPVIVISGYKDISDVLKYGANDYMEKPVDPILLQERIKRLLNLSQN